MHIAQLTGFKRVLFQQQKKVMKNSQSPKTSGMETDSNTQAEIKNALHASEKAKVPKILSPGSKALCSDWM